MRYSTSFLFDKSRVTNPLEIPIKYLSSFILLIFSKPATPKLRLKKEEDGTIKVKVHPIQRLSIPEKYMGHKFTDAERNKLVAERNLGKTIELTGKDGKKDNYYLALDPKTNELIPLRTKNIKVPDKIRERAFLPIQRMLDLNLPYSDNFVGCKC